MRCGWSLLRALILLISCLLLCCGLPGSRAALVPPNVLEQILPGTLRFGNPLPDDPDQFAQVFLGYEIYYKFLSIGDTAATNISSRAALVQAGFVRLTHEDDRDIEINKPIIELDSSDEDVVLRFDLIPSSGPIAQYNGQTTLLRRGILKSNNNGEFEDFNCEHFLPDHVDVESIFTENEDPCTATVQLLAYAISFGRKAGHDILSKSRFLGSLIISFP